MALDKKKTEKKSSSEDSSIDEFLSSSIDDDEDVDVSDIKPRGEDDDNDEDYELDRDKKKDKSKSIIIFSVILCLVVVIASSIIVYVSSQKSKKQEKQMQAEIQQAQQQAAKASKSKERNTKAGAPNLNSNTKDQNDSAVTGDQLVTNLNGQSVDTNYKIRNIQTVRDYINYTKYRTVTGTGLEFYWLNATYKENNYIVQVPYQVFKELDDTGITLVDVEVTTLADDKNSEIVTYMNVVKNAKSIINGGK